MNTNNNNTQSPQSFDLSLYRKILVKQKFEALELFGLESRNKYELWSESKQLIGIAIELSQGIGGWIARQFFGHWRSFEVSFFDPNNALILKVKHPFKILFSRLQIHNSEGVYLGAIQQRFAIFSKRFDIENENGTVIMEVSSPLWKMWTFNFMHAGNQLASITKKWTGLFAEAFTDKDTFLIDYSDEKLSNAEKQLILGSAIYIDLVYFENKAGK